MMTQMLINTSTTLVEDKLAQRQKDILGILARAAEEKEFLVRLAEDPAEALSEYYTLNSEELAALASGDIGTIEKWVGKLDKKHATWLMARLSQERW